MTAREVRAIDAYCAERGIELVPNFTSAQLHIGGDEPWELGKGRSAYPTRGRTGQESGTDGRARVVPAMQSLSWPEQAQTLQSNNIALSFPNKADCQGSTCHLD